MNATKPRIAIVVARYGPEVLGGAESLARGFAEEAVHRGWYVDVLTTCALSSYEWKNVLGPGVEKINGVTVKRFPVRPPLSSIRRALEDRLRIQHSLQVREQYEWLRLGPQSYSLYSYLSQRAVHYEFIITLPYLDSIAYHAAWQIPQKTILWPCLHDEVLAYQEPFRLLSESVWGLLFNSPEESDLAVSTLKWQPNNHATLGLGVKLLVTHPAGVDGNGLNLLYVGRLEHAKNLSILYDYASRFKKEEPDFQLKIVGTGPFSPPNEPGFQTTGFVPEEDKAGYYSEALALCQPSINESLSLVIMESWLAGRPVLVSMDCPVTIGHVRRARGGLGFKTYNEFAGALLWLAANPVKAKYMGQNGRNYVLSNYTWNAVFDRLAYHLGRWQTDGTAAVRTV